MKLYRVYVENDFGGDERITSEILFVDLEDAKSAIEEEHEIDESAEIWLSELDTDRKGSYGQVYVEENTRIY